MPRYRITIEYDGTPFAGWQVQPVSPSVQGALTEAIQRFSGESVVVKGAGRTDAGVHALGQVAHFDLAKDWDPLRVREAMNFHLKPAPVVVLECVAAESDFDARFSATARHYLYRILTRRAPPALDRNRVWWLTTRLDAGRHARGGGDAHWPSRFHDLSRRPVPGEVAAAHARPPGRRGGWLRRFASRRRRAPSSTTRCARWSAA